MNMLVTATAPLTVVEPTMSTTEHYIPPLTPITPTGRPSGRPTTMSTVAPTAPGMY